MRTDNIIIIGEDDFKDIKRSLKEQNLENIEKILLNYNNKIKRNILYLGLFIFILLTMMMLAILFG